jgi:hypothetical protein
MLGHSRFKPFGRWVGRPCQVRQSGSPTAQGRAAKADNFLPEPLARGIVFQKSAAPRPGLLIGAGHRSFRGGGAKRNGVEAIENNEFREMPHFAPLMVSRAYACVAKSFASLREMSPSASPGSARRRRQKRGLRTRATALRGSAARKGGRRSRMAPQAADIVQNGVETVPDSRTPGNRSGELRYHADGRDVPPYAWGQAKLTREEQS